MHWDQEPIRFGPRAVPARSGRAKTRAWVIFQGCWRGPHAATGERSRAELRTGNTLGTPMSWRERSVVFSAWIGTMNLTTRWERGSVIRSTSLQPQVLRVTDPRSGTPGSLRSFPTRRSSDLPGTDQVRTAGGPRPQRPRKNQGVGDFPGVLARATRCDRGALEGRTSHWQHTRDANVMERALCRFFRMDWNHEPDNAVGARLCDPQYVATTPSSAGHRPALRDARFIEIFPYPPLFRSTRNRSGSDRGRSPPAAAAQKPGRG